MHNAYIFKSLHTIKTTADSMMSKHDVVPSSHQLFLPSHDSYSPFHSPSLLDPLPFPTAFLLGTYSLPLYSIVPCALASFGKTRVTQKGKVAHSRTARVSPRRRPAPPPMDSCFKYFHSVMSDGQCESVRAGVSGSHGQRCPLGFEARVRSR